MEEPYRKGKQRIHPGLEFCRRDRDTCEQPNKEGQPSAEAGKEGHRRRRTSFRHLAGSACPRDCTLCGKGQGKRRRNASLLCSTISTSDYRATASTSQAVMIRRGQRLPVRNRFNSHRPPPPQNASGSFLTVVSKVRRYIAATATPP